MLGTFAGGAAVAAFTAAPLLRYADPVELWFAGIAIAGAIVISLVEDEQPHGWVGILLTRLFGYGAIVFAVWWVSDWTKSARANDRRCLAIQRDMLSSMPLRSDDPDLFQALGCRPQGEGSVFAARPDPDDIRAVAEREMRRRALPYRDPAGQ